MAGFLRLGARRVLIAMSKLVKNGHLSSEVRITPAFLQPDTRFFGRDEEPEATKRGQKIALPPIAPTDGLAGASLRKTRAGSSDWPTPAQMRASLGPCYAAREYTSTRCNGLSLSATALRSTPMSLVRRRAKLNWKQTSFDAWCRCLSARTAV